MYLSCMIIRKLKTAIIFISILPLLLNCSKSSSNSKTGNFSVSGVAGNGNTGTGNYSGNSIRNINTFSGGINVSIIQDTSNQITFYNIPSSSSGTYNIQDAGNISVQNTTNSNITYAIIKIDNTKGIYAYVSPRVVFFNSTSGILTKTGINSFTANFLSYWVPLQTPFVNVTAKGTY